jgi:uncharacterized protein YndB with AHSA1/START domain
MNNDRIEKQVLLRAPRTRVWRALTDSEQFGQWFGVKMHGPFAAGARVTGKITIKNYDHLDFEIVIDRMEPETFFSWRWHPYAIDPKMDYSTEPMTLVEFTLDETPDGTLLKVVESGFEGVPLARRFDAFRGNEGGWEQQMKQIANYVGQAA